MKTVPPAALCFLTFAPALALAAPNHEFRGIQKLELKIDAGDVKVTGVDGELSTVGVVKKRYDERCRLIVEQRHETLFVELAPKGLFEARCEADFDFRLPKDVSLSLKNAKGNVAVAGMTETFLQRKPQSRK